MPLILDGTIARKHYEKELQGFIAKLAQKPKLAIIQVGANENSTAYIEQKKKCGARVGVEIDHVRLSENSSFEDLKLEIERQNKDDSVSGIIVQLPLPAHLEKQAVIDCIDRGKDVDGLTSLNKELLQKGDVRAFVPATAQGVMSLLSYYKIAVKGKKAAVLGRSDLVGKPTALVLSRAGAEVTVCHSKTPNTKEIALASDIVVVAIGKPELIDETYVKRDQVIVDIGFNSVKGALLEEIPVKKAVGDVSFAKVAPIVSAITPVPGGVGPMTVISLMENVFKALCDKIASQR